MAACRYSCVALSRDHVRRLLDIAAIARSPFLAPQQIICPYDDPVRLRWKSIAVTVAITFASHNGNGIPCSEAGRYSQGKPVQIRCCRATVT